MLLTKTYDFVLLGRNFELHDKGIDQRLRESESNPTSHGWVVRYPTLNH
jgi:hypothetical protein